MRFFRLLLWLLAGLPLCVQAQTEARKYSNEFLKIGVGAKAAGMGNAVTAVDGDVTAGYWNPAALLDIETRNEIGAMHSEYFAGIAKYDYLAFSTRIDSNRRLGISAIRLGIDDIPNTLNIYRGGVLDLSQITAFSEASLAVFISYAQVIPRIKGLTIGGNFKVINRIAGPFATAWGFGLDVAARYRRNRLTIGFMVSDLTSTFNLWSYNVDAFGSQFGSTGNFVPQENTELTLPSARLGLAYRIRPQAQFGGTVSMDIQSTFDGKRNTLVEFGRVSLDPRLGLEANYRNLIFLRGGLQNFQRLQREDGTRYWSVFPSAGLGIRLQIDAYTLQVDYALSNLGDFRQGFYSHLFSLRFAFDKVSL